MLCFAFQVLINNGADVDAKGYMGAAPLHYAARGGEVEVAEVSPRWFL